MITPIGVKLQLGQKWKEVDNRFTRIVKVVDWDTALEKVFIMLDTPGSKRVTTCKLKRFNGKNRGYKPVQIVTIPTTKPC